MSALAALLLALSALAPTGDTIFQLIWGRELMHGQAPSFEAGPTPHPLWIAVGALASILGRGAALDTFTGLAYVSFAALLWGAFRLGQVVCSWQAGVVAAAIVAASPQVVNFALGAYLDIPFLALIVLAGVLEARRPRRGAAVMALLALAGLLRPEAWLLEGAYWLYLLPALEPRKRVAMGALAAAAPILWALGDLLIAHDPLHSLTGTRAGAERLGRVTGAENVPHTLTTYLGRMLKLPVLVGGLAAFAAALIWRDRRLAVPAALAALGVGSYTALGVAGLSQLDRYVLLPGVAIAVLFGYATVGWTRMSPGPLRTGWAVVGLSLLAWAAAYLPDRARGIESGNAAIERRSRAIEDLESLTSRPAVRQAVRRCRPLNVDRARPYLAYQLDRPPQEVEHSRRPARGLYVGPATRGVAKDFLSPEHRERLRPPGFDKLARNRSWIVYERGCDEIASVSQAGLRAPPHLPRRSPPR